MSNSQNLSLDQLLERTPESIPISLIKKSKLTQKFSEINPLHKMEFLEKGFLPPILVVQLNNDAYHLVDGYSRLMTLAQLGIDKISAHIISQDEYENYKNQLIQILNVKSSDGISICKAVYKLRYFFSSQLELAQFLSKSKGYISKAIGTYIKFKPDASKLKTIPLRNLFTNLECQYSKAKKEFDQILEHKDADKWSITIKINSQKISLEENEKLLNLFKTLKANTPQ